MVLDIGEIGYLGIDYTQQYDSMARLLRGVKKDLPVFEGAWLNALGHQARTGFLRAACYKQIGIPGSAYRKSLADYFRKHEVQCMLAYWGTNPIADAISIKKYRPETRIILNILCHPIGVTPLKIRLQNWILQRSLKYFDGLIYPGTVMKRYFEREVKGAAEMPSLVLAPLLPRFSEAVEGPGLSVPAPNVLFMGRMDWWDGQTTDNVLRQIEALMDRGVHVYHSDKTGKLPAHAYRHTFPPMPVHALRPFAARFDASLMVYNLEACKRDDRFRNTIPDRLIASVAFGIPVAIPRKGYDACKEFLEDYGAVIEFDTAGELKTVLSDREKIRKLKELARANSKKYVLENYADRLFQFIDGICRNKGSGKNCAGSRGKSDEAGVCPAEHR